MATRVWFSHDVYRDYDDNFSIMTEAGMTVLEGFNKNNVRFVIGDTTDEGQWRAKFQTEVAMPNNFDDRNNPRYAQDPQNDQARGNYDFMKDYAIPAIRDELQFSFYDTLNNNGTGLWKVNPGQSYALNQLTVAARQLVTDINWAINNGGPGSADDQVIYSAGGGANVAAEAINYLLTTGGRTEAQVKANFTIIQHGRNNWVNQYEQGSKVITDEYTLAITNQNPNDYSAGHPGSWPNNAGPNLQNALNGTQANNIDGSAIGSEFDLALKVSIGEAAYTRGLSADADYNWGYDASDAGSGMFALYRAMAGDITSYFGARMVDGDQLVQGSDWYVNSGASRYARTLWNEFDGGDIRDAFDGDLNPNARMAAPKQSHFNLAAFDTENDFDFGTAGLGAVAHDYVGVMENVLAW